VQNQLHFAAIGKTAPDEKCPESSLREYGSTEPGVRSQEYGARDNHDGSLVRRGSHAGTVVVVPGAVPEAVAGGLAGGLARSIGTARILLRCSR